MNEVRIEYVEQAIALCIKASDYFSIRKQFWL